MYLKTLILSLSTGCSLLITPLALSAVPVEVKSLSTSKDLKVNTDIIDTPTNNANNNQNSTQSSNLEFQQLKQKNEAQEQQIAILKAEINKQNKVPNAKKTTNIFNQLPANTKQTDTDSKNSDSKVTESKFASKVDGSTKVQSTPKEIQNGVTLMSYAGDEDKKSYIQAYETFKAGGAGKAVEPMRDFIAKYPNSPYMPNAHYWLGEFYLASNPPSFLKAKQEFSLVSKQYPKTAKAAAATYRLATMAEVEDNVKMATNLMQRIVVEYPKSQEANFAKSFLAQNAKTKKPTPKKQTTNSAVTESKTPSNTTMSNTTTSALINKNASNTLNTKNATSPSTSNLLPSTAKLPSSKLANATTSNTGAIKTAPQSKAVLNNAEGHVAANKNVKTSAVSQTSPVKASTQKPPVQKTAMQKPAANSNNAALKTASQTNSSQKNKIMNQPISYN